MVWIILCAAALVAAAVYAYRAIMWPAPLKTGTGSRQIACVGDSITYSLGVVGRRKKWSYPALLHKKMSRFYTTINYGLSDRTLRSKADKPYFAEKVGQDAWNTPAETVIFMLGSNDCKRKNWNAVEFAVEYEAVVRHYAVDEKKRLIVMIPPRIFYANPGKSGYDDALVREGAAPVVRALAEKYSVACIDLYALTKDHPEWFPDKLHPNKAGNEAIAALVAAALSEK